MANLYDDKTGIFTKNGETFGGVQNSIPQQGIWDSYPGEGAAQGIWDSYPGEGDVSNQPQQMVSGGGYPAPVSPQGIWDSYPGEGAGGIPPQGIWDSYPGEGAGDGFVDPNQPSTYVRPEVREGYTYDPFNGGRYINNATGLPDPAPQPVTVDPNQTNYTDAIDLINKMFGQDFGGYEQDFLPSQTGNDLTQLLTDNLIKQLNQPIGYTPEEQQQIRDAALGSFERGNKRDVQNITNLAESYGFNQGSGLGGQASGAFQDLYGDQAVARGQIESDLSQQFLNQQNIDLDRVQTQGQNLANLINSQDRGAFADQLSLMDFNLMADTQALDNGLKVAGFLTDEQQREFLNGQGISDREWERYTDIRDRDFSEAFNTADFNNRAEATNFDQLLRAQGYNTEEEQRKILNERGYNQDQADNYFKTLDVLTRQDSILSGVESGAIETQEGVALLMAMYAMGAFGNNKGTGTGEGDGGGLGEIVVGGVKWVWDKLTGAYKKEDAAGDAADKSFADKFPSIDKLITTAGMAGIAYVVKTYFNTTLESLGITKPEDISDKLTPDQLRLAEGAAAELNDNPQEFNLNEENPFGEK